MEKIQDKEKTLRDFDVVGRQERLKRQNLLAENKKMGKTKERLEAEIEELLAKKDDAVVAFQEKENDKAVMMRKVEIAKEELVGVEVEAQEIQSNLDIKKEELDERELGLDKAYADKEDSLNRDMDRCAKLCEGQKEINSKLSLTLNEADKLKLENKALKAELKSKVSEAGKELSGVNSAKRLHAKEEEKLKQKENIHLREVEENASIPGLKRHLEDTIKEKEEGMRIKEETLDSAIKKYEKLAKVATDARISFEKQKEAASLAGKEVHRDRLRVRKLIDQHDIEDEIKKLEGELEKTKK